MYSMQKNTSGKKSKKSKKAKQNSFFQLPQPKSKGSTLATYAEDDYPFKGSLAASVKTEKESRKA